MPLRTLSAKNFFNRYNELEIFKGVAAEALIGNATDIYLSGRRGIGKTELLKHLFNYIFLHHNDVIPFFYTINTSFISVEGFSKDYIGKFILQSLAFQKKDPYMIDAGIYSLELLRQLAKDSDAQWAVQIIDNYSQIKTSSDPINMFLFAISVPYHCYLSRNIPVVVMIDDFHKTRDLYEVNPKDKKDLWMHFEKSIKSRYTPHIFTGLQAEINKMFFEEASFGEHLELINLEGLNRNDSIAFFTSLCELYGLNIKAELHGLVNTFNGNPFYIKSFAQAARQAGKTLSADDFWEIYFREITKGKIYTYWITKLKTHITQFDLRRPSLNFLHHLCGNNVDIGFSNLSESLSIERTEFNHIINLLQASGIVKTGYSLLELADDQVLIDVLKGLYLKEIKREPLNKIKDLIIFDRLQLLKKIEEPTFDITIPSVAEAELVAIKSLQQIAHHFKISSEATGQIQIALVELFTNVLPKDFTSGESYNLKFKLKGQTFSVEITTPQEGFTLSDDDRDYIREYLDDIKIEKTIKGTRVTLLKVLKKDVVSTS